MEKNDLKLKSIELQIDSLAKTIKNSNEIMSELLDKRQKLKISVIEK